MKSTRPYLSALALLCLLTPLGGCFGILDEMPPDQYLLNPPLPTQALCVSPDLPQIVVNQPASGGDLMTDHIAMLFNGREVRYLSGAKWDATAPQAVKRLLEQRLVASGCFRGVGVSSGDVAAAYRVSSDLQRMHLVFADEKNAPTAEMRLMITLIRPDSGKIVGQRVFQSSFPAGGTSKKELVDALENASDALMLDCAAWVQEALAADSAASDKKGK